MKKITSIDITRKTFETLKVEKIVIDYAKGMVQIFYDDCISPMVVEVNDYEMLLDGHVVELHHGEIALVIEN
jgi:hypothetical protein